MKPAQSVTIRHPGVMDMLNAYRRSGKARSPTEAAEILIEKGAAVVGFSLPAPHPNHVTTPSPKHDDRKPSARKPKEQVARRRDAVGV